MKFMANVILYLAESSQKCSAVLLDKICQIAQTGWLLCTEWDKFAAWS